MKKKIAILLAVAATTLGGLTSCGGGSKSEVEKVIEEAMTLDAKDLYKKAMEELDGKTMTGIGNSSRGKTAKEYFINYLKGNDADGNPSTAVQEAFPYYNPNFTGQIEWTQPKENSIFTMIDSDVNGSNHSIAMTLIQDANQIDAKEIQTGNLLNYVPKEWNGDADNKEPFALQSLNKVFEFNNLDTSKTFMNCWDFVREGETPLFMKPSSEPVGRNFLIMLTQQKYSDILKNAYEAISDATQKARIETTADGLKEKATQLGLTHDSAKYALAYIQLFVKQYAERSDDGPICNELVTNSARGASGLLVYSKLRSVTETEESSKKNVTIAAYQDGYKGIGGFMYKHYLQVLKTSPYPWTSCAFIHFMTCTYDGFKAWGKDIGGYCSNNTAGINQDHSQDGGTEFACLNDKGYEFWTGTGDGKGNMVVEDGAYCSEKDVTVGTWIDTGIK